jgi:hypothetical protein
MPKNRLRHCDLVALHAAIYRHWGHLSQLKGRYPHPEIVAKAVASGKALKALADKQSHAKYVALCSALGMKAKPPAEDPEPAGGPPKPKPKPPGGGPGGGGNVQAGQAAAALQAALNNGLQHRQRPKGSYKLWRPKTKTKGPKRTRNRKNTRDRM